MRTVACVLFAALCGFGQTSRFFDSGGVRIHYTTQGEGEPVILIHGFSANVSMWEPLAKSLSQRYQVIAMDCRGHGASGKPHEPALYGIEMVNDVVRLMDHLNIRQAHIGGYSLGGSIVLKMLVAHPERFLSATVAGSAGFRSTDKEVAPDLVRYLQSGMKLSEAIIASAPGMPPPSPEQRQMMKRMDEGQDPLALAAQRLGNSGLTIEYADLKANPVPILVLYGEKDNPERFGELKSALPGAEFRVIAGAGHGETPESPQFLAYVGDFLDRHALGPAFSQLPATPAARQLAQWLHAYNSGSQALLSDFYERNFPAGRSRLEAEIDRRHNLTGGFDLKQVEQCDAATCSAFLEMRDRPGYSRVRVALQPGQPDRVAELETQPVPRPTGIPSERTTEAAALDAFRSKLEIDTAADRFSGAVLIARNDKVLFSRAYGLSDRAKKIPNTLQTRFRLGSMNKLFTAVAVLQLAEAGKIKLDDPLGKYLTDYPNRDVAGKVQIRHLLTHTGGTGDIFGPEFAAHRLELRTLRDYLDLYGKRGVEFEPGTRRAYSNYGFVLLGALVERVSGQSYYDYVRDHIFKPSGMTRSDSQPEDEAVEGRATGYTRPEGEEEWTTNANTLPYRGTSAGGGYSTVEDLLNFALALQAHKLLSEHSFDLLVRGEPVTAGGRPYPFGSGVRNWEGAPYFGHNGGAPGMNTDLEIGLESGYVIVVLSNLDPPAAQRISEFIVSRLPEK